MTKTLKFLTFFLLLISFSLAPASSVLADENFNLLDSLGGAEDDILDPDDAFKISYDSQPGLFKVNWVIADGHYLYRDKMQITTDEPGINSNPLIMPQGDAKDDPIFNKTLYVFHNDVDVSLPYQYNDNGDKETTFKVKYQGCSEISGICYPPQTKKFTVKLSPISEAQAAALDTSSSEPVSEQDEIANVLKSGNTWLTLIIFFGAGLLLAFTPCVFPMIPILSGIIIGQGEEITTRKAFYLSLVYVLAMALTYTVVGILVGLSGENIQAWFQNPWIIGSFVAIFVALSLSMFGFYELQMPASIQSKLTNISNSQQGGNIVGVAIMGFLSALIVGPCVTAPLVGALIYIAETGDAVLGGMALFSLSMGMGAPLLLIGASAGKFLPKAGAWMDAVKAVFGVLLLGLAIWLLERVAPAAATMALWAALIIVSAIYMGAMDSLAEGSSGWKKLWKGLGVLLLIYGIIILLGLASGNRNVYQPLKGLAGISGSAAQVEQLSFNKIKGVEGFHAELERATAAGKPVMLDFYADWCVSCKEMEAFTFSDPAVQKALDGVVLLKADVTLNDEKDTELYKHFGIIGPPSIMFFGTDGKENKNYRVVGFMPADKFSEHVKRALN
ncbi:MAG: protein-disulfide reductase DsbD [Gammaproteobacteria bacterium]|nr:protein-disulfide reductase DsbD [Gammaproteobacteria bacterium]MBT8134012.1 protein-disulfide reductase DsbD [Gammaproteobacteria bacterium]NNJ50805.1 protein-disulfide reductase DsbD [Gammaproteobacteria bacterium]